MIESGKNFESIVSLLNKFREEVKSFASLGYLNINKHSENFVKRILNLSNGLELENLNKDKSNFPGIDLGDTDDKVAYQITSAKKSDKIDHTLEMCLKYRHYETFGSINVFVLTNKQSTYSLKTVTEPYFTFNPAINILDFSDLFKIIEELDPSRIKRLLEFIQMELEPTLEVIKNDGDSDKIQVLLDPFIGMQKTGMTTFFKFQSKATIIDKNITVPTIHSILSSVFQNAATQNSHLPIFNSIHQKELTNKEILYLNEISNTGVGNIFIGQAFQILDSTISYEVINYDNQDITLTNLRIEMLALLSSILTLYKSAGGNCGIDVTVKMESSAPLHFHPNNSIVLNSVMKTFTLVSPSVANINLKDVRDSTLVNLLQEIMHCFIGSEPSHFDNNPFIQIDVNNSGSIINKLKKMFDLSDYNIY